MQQTSSLLKRFGALGATLFLGLASLGCAARYSNEALHAMAPNAAIVDVCVRPPTADPDATAWAYRKSDQETVSDGHWEAFKEFARSADYIYRFDPDMPGETASILPNPYNTMSCWSVAARDTPPLPTGMKEIPISLAMREALVSALIELPSEQLRPAPRENAFLPSRPDPRYLAQNLFIGPANDGRTPQQRIEAVGQMLRDALRSAAPKIKGPNDEHVSIIDTDAGQVIGGVGAGAVIGWAPGGVFIADAMQNSPNVPKPTPQFQFGQGVGQMGSGFVQLGGGGMLMAGGTGMSATGVGLVAGVPTCTAGVVLAANGTITLIHGAHTVLVALCNWHELDDPQPLAAVAPKDAAGPPAPPPASPAPAPAPVKPPPAPVKAAPVKPAPAPVQAAPVKPVTAPVKAAPVKAAPVKAVKPAPPVKPAPVKPAPPPVKPTDPTVVTIRASGNKTIERPRLQEGQKPSDVTLTVRTDDARKVQSITVEVQAAELKPYNQGQGHHVPSKRALEGAPNYDANKALAVPKDELEKLRVRHNDITRSQRRQYIDFGKTGETLTWEAVAKIETQALITAKMQPQQARATVAKAIQALKDSGVPGPVRIPWGPK